MRMAVLLNLGNLFQPSAIGENWLFPASAVARSGVDIVLWRCGSMPCGRARRGASGALYPQTAIAGLNSRSRS